MMEVNIMNPVQTATHAIYTIFCSWQRIMESGAYCGSTLHTIYYIERQRKTVGSNVLNHYGKVQFCCNGLTLSERKVSTSTSAPNPKLYSIYSV